MEEERIPKRVLNGNFHTTRPVGRPRTRWVDVVQKDALQMLGIRGWRSKAANRDEWRHLMSETKARKGLNTRAFFLGGRRGMRTPKHFVNLTGESKNFKMLEFPLNQLSIDCFYFFRFEL
jgi:hypothetical protein